MIDTWNPWHGCTKISPGCLNCYVYRIDHIYKRDPTKCVQTQQFDLPIRRNRNGEYKIPSGSVLYTCFSSDFFLQDADYMRPIVWNYIRERQDIFFTIITKRIHRFYECIPEDWNNGWDNVNITCTIENQDMANFRLPIYRSLPIKHKSICTEPLLEYIDLSQIFGDPMLEYVISGGESGSGARYCDLNWVLKMKFDCESHGIPFCFKQTGARFINNDSLQVVARKDQYMEADKLNISDFHIDNIPVIQEKRNIEYPVEFTDFKKIR